MWHQLLVAWLLLLLLCARISIQQGLQFDPNTALRASSSYETLKNIYGNSKVFKQAFATGRASQACSRSQGSLCSPYSQTMEQRGAMLIATSPQSFDARSHGAMGSFSAVAQPKDQGQCNSCVAFALLAAAQSAMACALKQDASSSISEQDFFFCKSVSQGEERTCSSSWSMRQGIEALVAMSVAGKYPVIEDCMPWNPSNPTCSYDCQDVQGMLKQGSFSYVRLDSAWEMQEHIRNWGSVVTRLDVHSDFKPFFAKNPSGVYPGHGPKTTFVTSHAVQVVGYDLASQPPYWLCKNSWSTNFAAGGFFKIAMGVDSVGNADDTYGIKFKPFAAARKPYSRLSPTGSGGCYSYRALPSDYVSRVAYVFGSTPQQVLLDNKDSIRQPDQLLTDMTILLCGISMPAAASGGSSSTSAAAQPQQQQQQQQQQPSQLTPAPPKPPAPVTYPAPRPVVAQPAPVVQQQQQPATSVKLGTYQGLSNCDGTDMPSTITITPGNGESLFEAEVVALYRRLWNSCDVHMKASCGPSSKGLCRQGQEAIMCRYHTVIKWPDTCWGIVRPRATRVDMCYSAGSFILVEQNPPCSRFTGTLTMARKRMR
uniref:Peptidase C1A papain C-terminal domain-containing protein n=1 Tax=Tetradesmus obliquus TaxID=3088 RepID=A0A383WDA4_TETOB|eukprot:jgi/Sobl393_1/12586/SZX75213.1